MQYRLDGKHIDRLRPGAHGDGHGLALKVQRSGSRSWIQRIKIRDGPNIEMGLGGYPIVSLEEARSLALANRKKARKGMDPRRPKVQTFNAVAKRWLAEKLTENPAWSEAAIWERRMAQHIRPRIGNRPIDSIEAKDITGIRDKCPSFSTAKRCVAHIAEILDLAEDEGLRVGNPGRAILRRMKKPRAKNYDWIPADQLPKWMDVIAESRYPDVVRRMVRFMHFIPLRNSEVRNMRWEELKGNVWTIPDRMKGKDAPAFRVVLPELARALIGNVRRRGYVWDLGKGNQPDKNYTTRMRKRLELPYSPHGLRHSFETWGVEIAKLDSELIQRCTAHSIRKPDQSATYQHYDYVDECAAVYVMWIRYLTQGGERPNLAGGEIGPMGPEGSGPGPLKDPYAS